LPSKPRSQRIHQKTSTDQTQPSDDLSPGESGSVPATEDQQIQIPVLPTVKIEIYPLTEALAWLVLGNVLAEGKFTLDRGQLIGLGSALIKAGNAMPSTKELEKVSGLIVPG
jgi:hypothetical protein